jgi:hypothetical protein
MSPRCWRQNVEFDSVFRKKITLLEGSWEQANETGSASLLACFFVDLFL